MPQVQQFRVDLAVGLFLWAALAILTATDVLGSYGPTGQLEVAAVVLLAASVWLAVKNSILTWPVGILGTAAYLYLFYGWGLYADAGLQGVYIALGFAGLWAWVRRGERRDATEAGRAGSRHLAVVVAAVVIGTVVMREYLLAVGGSAPFWDAFLTSGSLGAQYLLIRKYIENWYLWAIVDVGYVALFASRELYLSAALYALFLWMVLRAVREWRELLRPTPAPQGAG